MKQEEILSAVVTVHNILADISVKGDDTMRMAQALQQCRLLVKRMEENMKAERAELADSEEA